MHIRDELVLRFRTEVLQELQDNEVYLIIGGARKKYNKNMDRSYESIYMKIIRSNDPQIFLREVHKASVVLDHCYMRDGRIIPDDSKVIYVTFNPRNVKRAFMETMKRGLDLFDNNPSKLSKYDRIFISELQKRPSRSELSILDIDTRSTSALEDALKIIGDDVHNVTLTRGGYHIIYRKYANHRLIGKSGINTLHQRYGKESFEIHRDRLTPVWGTVQGGHDVVPVT